MYWFKTPALVAGMFPALTWRVPGPEKTLYFTFDDGPTPGITPWVMDLFDQYEAKGTFFSLGKNALAHPELIRELLDRGHTIGNHSFSHLNARKVTADAYLKDVEKAQKAFQDTFALDLRNFRPPYGMLTRKTKNSLVESHRVVMWEVLSGDFDQKVSAEKCEAVVREKAVPGSIIVFHDSRKCASKLKYALPKLLEEFHQQGFQFAALPR